MYIIYAWCVARQLPKVLLYWISVAVVRPAFGLARKTPFASFNYRGFIPSHTYVHYYRRPNLSALDVRGFRSNKCRRSREYLRVIYSNTLFGCRFSGWAEVARDILNKKGVCLCVLCIYFYVCEPNCARAKLN